MDVEKYLENIKRYDIQIRNKQDEVYRLRTMACNTSTHNNVERVQKSTDKDKIGSIMSAVVDMEHEIDGMIDKRAEIVHQIEEIDITDYYDVLFKRFVLCKELKEIAADKKMTERQVANIKKKAIKYFNENFTPILTT